LIQDEIDEDSWGVYAALYSLCHICSLFADYGLNQYLTKEISGNSTQKENLISKVFSLKLISAFVFPTIMIVIGLALGYETKWLGLLFFVAIIHSLIQFFGFFRAVIQGNQLYHLEPIASNIDKTLLIIFSFVLFLIPLNIWTFTYTRILAILISCIGLFFVCYRYKLIENLKFTVSDSSKTLKAGLPFAFIILVYGINEKVDQVMVERLTQKFTDFNHSAVYSAAYRLVDAVMMYLWIVLPMFFAKFSHSQTDSEKSQKLIQTGTALAFLPIAFVATFSIFHSDLLFTKLFNKYSASSVVAMSDLFAVLSYTLLLQGLFAILSTYLTSTGHEKYVTKLVIISIAFNMIGNFILIPKFGAFAAAWCTFGSALIVVFGYIFKIMNNKLANIPFILWTKLIFISMASTLAYYMGNFHSRGASISLGIIVFMALALILRPIKLEDVKNIR
jgi:O-antigen/teichoic acid export membrane protein